MGKHIFIILFYIFCSAFAFFGHKFVLLKRIRFAGVKNKYYPKGYIKPCNFIAEKYNIRVEMPRFAYISAIVRYIYLLQPVVCTAIYCFTGFKNEIASDLLLYGILLLPAANLLWMDIWGEIYRKGRKD